MNSCLMTRFLTTVFCWISFSVYGKCCGKIDVGPAWVEIDILKSGKTEKTLDMPGIKGDATILLYQGFCVKPGFLWAQKGRAEVASGTIGVGYCLPVGYCFPLLEKLTIVPNIGVTWSYLRAHLDVEVPAPPEAVQAFGISQIKIEDVRERFRSTSGFVGLEFCYSLTEKWTLIGVYQYAWSRTHTKLTELGTFKSHSCGPNYALGVDYSLNRHWSITLGVGYNITLSKEKHGLRGKGAKLGVAYYF